MISIIDSVSDPTIKSLKLIKYNYNNYKCTLHVQVTGRAQETKHHIHVHVCTHVLHVQVTGRAQETKHHVHVYMYVVMYYMYKYIYIFIFFWEEI